MLSDSGIAASVEVSPTPEGPLQVQLENLKMECSRLRLKGEVGPFCQWCNLRFMIQFCTGHIDSRAREKAELDQSLEHLYARKLELETRVLELEVSDRHLIFNRFSSQGHSRL